MGGGKNMVQEIEETIENSVFSPKIKVSSQITIVISSMTCLSCLFGDLVLIWFGFLMSVVPLLWCARF